MSIEAIVHKRVNWRRFRSALRATALGGAWRLRHRALPLSKDALITVAVPLISRTASGNWERVVSCLETTLRSILAQTNPRWELILCGQDKPATLPQDPRISFLLFPTDKGSPQVNDKYLKIPYILQQFAASPARDGYFFILDADDIIHPELFDYMLSCGERGGYIIDKGYMLDAASGHLAWMGPADELHPNATAFYLHCGSCSAIRLDRRRWKNWQAPIRMRGQHQWQLRNLQCFGLRLAAVPFHAAIYIVNHGENAQARKGKIQNKLSYVNGNLISDEEKSRAVRAFGLSDM